VDPSLWRAQELAMQNKLVALGSVVLVLASACVSAPAARSVEANVRYQADAATPTVHPLRWSFDEVRDGGLLPSTVVFSGIWGAQPEPGTPSPPQAFCQTGRAAFPAIALSDDIFGDVVVTARFKPVFGREDQAAGLLFRIQDKDNYYVLRANALEYNVNFYKYAGGRRTSLKDGRAHVIPGQWHELRGEAVGNTLRGFLNGEQVVEVTDDTYQAGRIGLWTKADSLTCFDDVEARAP
jgi:hypothetical protein